MVGGVGLGARVLDFGGDRRRGRRSFGGLKWLEISGWQWAKKTEYWEKNPESASSTGRGKCFPQQLSELLWSNVGVQPDDRGRGWSCGAFVCGALRRLVRYLHHNGPQALQWYARFS